jgi:hypothetical protein
MNTSLFVLSPHTVVCHLVLDLDQDFDVYAILCILPNIQLLSVTVSRKRMLYYGSDTSRVTDYIYTY